METKNKSYNGIDSINNIVFIDSTTDYPYKFSAGNTKVELLAKGLIECGDRITIINNPVIGSRVVETFVKEDHNGITCYTFQKNKSFGGLINGYTKIFQILKSSKDPNNRNFIIISDPPYFFMFLIDYIFAKILGFKLCMLFHEWHIAVDSIGTKQKIGAYFFDHLAGYMCHAILPISEFLILKSKKFKKPLLKIPIIAQFKQVDNVVIDREQKTSYFLYCGGAQYIEAISILISHFERLILEGENIDLVLVLYGEKKYFNLVEIKIKECNLQDRIIIKSSLPFSELFNLYSCALALLIPLRNTVQDKARFSQKIAEYLSAKRPIITTNVGEIPVYFKDGIDAFIADTFDGDDFFYKMKFVIKNQILADQVGLNGFELGINEFDNKLISQKLHNFFKTI